MIPYPRLALAFAAALALSSSAGRAADQGPIVVPLYPTRYSDGATQLGIDVTIGSKTRRLLFDTGLSGLRVLASALPDDAYKRTGREAKASYGSGIEVQGEEADAAVAVGAAHGANVPFEVIDRLACSPHLITDCPKELIESKEFAGIYPGIFGAYLQAPLQGCCASALYFLDGKLGRRFIVHANFAGPTLTLNPDPATMRP